MTWAREAGRLRFHDAMGRDLGQVGAGRQHQVVRATVDAADANVPGDNDIYFIDIGPMWGGHEGDAGDTFVAESPTQRSFGPVA